MLCGDGGDDDTMARCHQTLSRTDRAEKTLYFSTEINESTNFSCVYSVGKQESYELLLQATLHLSLTFILWRPLDRYYGALEGVSRKSRGSPCQDISPTEKKLVHAMMRRLQYACVALLFCGAVVTAKLKISLFVQLVGAS